MTPVESVIPLNTCLSHLDEYDARMKIPSSSANSSGTTSRRSHSHEDVSSNSHNTHNAQASHNTQNTSSPTVSSTSTPTAKAIQVQFRKKETEEQVLARLNSFSHLQRQIDDESWINLKHFNPQVFANNYNFIHLFILKSVLG